MQKQPRHYFNFGDFRIDVGERTLHRQGKPVPLTPKAFDTLLVLVENSGRVLEKEELFKRVWPDTFVAEVTLARNISTLRQALGDQAEARLYIETVPRRGYRFIAEVQNVQEAEPEVIGDANSDLMGFETMPVGKHLIIERHLVSQVVSQVVTEQDEIPQVRNEGSPMLTGQGAGKPYWIASKWATLMIVSLLTALATALVVDLWTTSHARQTPSDSTIHTLAVLPLKSVSPEHGDEYLGVGITDRLVDDLSKLPQVVVRPTSAVLKYTASDTNAVDAGRELNVEAVLVGSVQKSGARMRTSLQLVRISDGAALWVKNFDEEYVSLFRLQDEIADQVTRAMRLELRENDRRQMASRGTESLVAYEAYMRGRFFVSERTRESTRRAIEYFQQAVSADPNYALGYAGLADCFILSDTSPSPRSESYARAKAAVLQALALDASLADAHASLGAIKFRYEWDWAGADSEFRRATESKPNDAVIHQQYAVFLNYMGKNEAAIAEIAKAHELDPLSLNVSTQRGLILLWGYHYKEGMEQLNKVLEMDPNFVRARLNLGDGYAFQGMYKEAAAEVKKALLLAKNEPSLVATLASIYAAMGEKRRVMQLLPQVKTTPAQKGFRAFALATIYADLGETEAPLKYLQEAYEEHMTGVLSIKRSPTWDRFRSDPRFVALIKHIDAGSAGIQ